MGNSRFMVMEAHAQLSMSKWSIVSEICTVADRCGWWMVYVCVCVCREGDGCDDGSEMPPTLARDQERFILGCTSQRISDLLEEERPGLIDSDPIMLDGFIRNNGESITHSYNNNKIVRIEDTEP